MLNLVTAIIRSYTRCTPEEDIAFREQYEGFFKEISDAIAAYYKILTDGSAVIHGTDDSLTIGIPRHEHITMSLDDDAGDDVFNKVGMYFLHESLQGLYQSLEERSPRLLKLTLDLEKEYQDSFSNRSKFHYCASLVFGALICVMLSHNDEALDKIESPFSPQHKKMVHEKIERLLNGYEYIASTETWDGMLTCKITKDRAGSLKLDKFFRAED